MRILAFDPGFERLGAAVLEREGSKEILLHSACLRTPTELPFPERLRILGEETEALINRWEPQGVALEELYFQKNEKTAMKVAEVRGMLKFIAAQHALPLFEYTPLEVKVAVTGYGKSDKKAIAVMIPRLVHLPPGKRLDDELDAIAIALTCLACER